MPSLTDRQISFFAMLFAGLAVAVSIVSCLQSTRQSAEDYDAAVLLSPGVLPIKTIPSDKPVEVEITIANTSKKNLAYYLKVDTNSACVTGSESKPQLVPCRFESPIIKISKIDAGNHSFRHKIAFTAPTSVPMSAMAYHSEPEHSIRLEVVNAANGKSLFLSECYYFFDTRSKSLQLYRTVMDTSGESQRLQARCEG